MKKMRFLSLFLALLMLISTFAIFSVSADEPTLEVLGAQIRTSGTQGIRFIGRVKKSAVTGTGASANFGFLIIPQNLMEENAALVYNTSGAKKVQATNLMPDTSVAAAGLTYDGSYYYFTVVLTGIPEDSYGTTLATKAYLNTSGTNYTYSNSTEKEKRSIYSVAQTIADQGGSIPTFVTTVINKYNQVGTDMLVADIDRWFSPTSGSYASSALQNTYARLTTAKKLNVGYLGGSITKGVGASNQSTTSWRALTTSWLKTNFPAANITEVNAAIGGTGSVFGAYRLVDDLKLKTIQPDLLFIDFAINDQYDGITVAEVKSYIETIIRTVYEYSPYCDIIMVYTTDRSRLNKTDSTNYPCLAAQHQVATTYGLTEIYVGKLLCEEYKITSTTTWDNSNLFADIVHPVDAGHAKYAGYITSVLNTELSKNLNPYGYVKHSIPSASYSPLSYTARYFFNASKGKTTGFNLYEDTNLDEKGYLKPNAGETGAKVKFTFVGTGLQLWTYARTVSSTIKVTVDGSSTNYTIQRGGSDGNKPYRVASGLSNTTHTVTIEVTATSSTSSSNVLDLMALMVEGDPNFTGVSFINLN